MALNFTCTFQIAINSPSLMKFWDFCGVEISVYFYDLALTAFIVNFFLILQMASNFPCMFEMLIPINSASLMKFGELSETVKIASYSDGIFHRKFNFSAMGKISYACFRFWFQ